MIPNFDNYECDGQIYMNFDVDNEEETEIIVEQASKQASKLKVLELYSGYECMSKAFRAKGHETLTVDWDKKFNSDLNIDVNEVTPELVKEKLGGCDVVFAGTDCTTYSVAAISHHREKIDGKFYPKTDYAEYCDNTNRYVRKLAKDLGAKVVILENPRGAMRRMDFVSDLKCNSTTYCQYGFSYMKPTDFFSNIDLELKPPCKNGDPCHEKAPRGSKNGIQAIKDKSLKALYPPKLCEHIVNVCEKYCR